MAAGLLLLILGFASGVAPTSSSANPPGYSCPSVIPASLLVSGIPREGTEPATRVSRAERRAEANCRAVVRVATWSTWGGLGLGFSLLVVGWTAWRERDSADGLEKAVSLLA
jgi:hypothetical protein